MEPLVIEQLPAGRRALRLAIVTETYLPEVNGVSLSLARMVDGLRANGHDIQLVRPRQDREDLAASGEGFAEMLTRGVPIPRYPQLKLGLPARKALLKQWKLRRPDLVHIVTEGPLGWSALQAATQLRIAVTSDFRTNFHAYTRHYGIGWLKKPIFGYLRKFHNRTLATFVPTEAMRGELAALGFRNLHVLSRGVDTNLFAPERRTEALRRAWGAGPDTPVVLHVGRIAAEKNLGLLVDAALRIGRERPDAKVVLVGDGPETRGLRERLPEAHFAGLQRGESLAMHYASADLFLFPSCTETFGNVTLEAMASGLPLVAYDYAAAAAHVRHGTQGLLAPFGRAEAFVELAHELVAMHRDRPARFREMGAQARMTAQALDWNAIVGRFERLLSAAA
ncbi:MAG: glycosyltransferase family 1 protein [Betaproteobacteria bacterium]|nr:glycosyltransferase family 1 protein [Betaproteobacteria bacterium]